MNVILPVVTMNLTLQRTCSRIFFASHCSHVAKCFPQALYHRIVLSTHRNLSSVTCGTSIRRTFAISTKQLEQPLEEERLPGYSHEQFYPIHIGDTLKSRYTVVGKLGFGANSTVWLCRDMRYVCIDHKQMFIADALVAMTSLSRSKFTSRLQIMKSIASRRRMIT